MDYKLIAIDMDGTLLTPELEISKETIQVVRKVIDKNVIVTLSTGRMYPAALPFANMLQLDVPLITCNGSLIKCAKTGKEYYKKAIEPEYCKEIIEYCVNNRLSLSVYKDDDIFIEKDSINLPIHDHMDKAEPIVVENMNDLIDHSIIKILFNSEDKFDLEYHTKILNELYKDKVNFYFSLPYFVEVVNKDANKRNALESLANKFNIKREEIIAIGDNYNDMDMIQYAGLGVAMDNAPDYLKDIADYVTLSNDEDGVRYVLENFVL